MCAVSNCRNVLVNVGHDNVFDAVYRDFEAKNPPGRKGSFSEDYRTSYLVLSEFCSLSFQVSGAGWPPTYNSFKWFPPNIEMLALYLSKRDVFESAYNRQTTI